MDAFAYPMMQNNEFELHDFIDDPSCFDQFIDLIRGENEYPIPNFDCKSSSECGVDNQFGSTAQDKSTMLSDLSFVLNSSFSSLNGGVNGGLGGDREEDDDGVDSSGKTRRTSNKKSKVDRSRTLISERRRRGRMKEKLYALRALVPNITKMDKTSIVEDAMLYVQELQTKAEKLKPEIAGLEASLVVGIEKYQKSIENTKKTQLRSGNQPVCKKILMQERGFYLRLVCNRGEGVAASLCRFLESLASFIVRNSNLATVSETFVLTFTLNIRDSEQIMHLPNLKLWVTSALLNQGFEVLTPLSS